MKSGLSTLFFMKGIIFMTKAELAVDIAIKELGVTNGSKYVKCYNQLTGNNIPLSSFWCACFVTWAAYLAEISTKSILPFCSCSAEVRWFKSQGRWNDKYYRPKKGDVIFLDWDNIPDGDHVGLVEKVIGNTVHTVEGNAGNNSICMRKTYPIGSGVVLGYGIPIIEEVEEEMTYEDFKKFMQQYETEVSKKPVSDWAKDSWLIACEEGFVDGSAPRSPSTREQEAHRYARRRNEKCPNWNREDVQWAIDNGILKGDGKEPVTPDNARTKDYITRGEAIAIAKRTNELKTIDAPK